MEVFILFFLPGRGGEGGLGTACCILFCFVPFLFCRIIMSVDGSFV